MLVCGAQNYAADFSYDRFKAIANETGIKYVIADIAETGGLIAGGQLKSPFDSCDIVMIQTGSTMRGPNSLSLIFT